MGVMTRERPIGAREPYYRGPCYCWAIKAVGVLISRKPAICLLFSRTCIALSHRLTSMQHQSEHLIIISHFN